MSEEPVEFTLKDFPGTRYYPKFKLITWHLTGIFDEALADKLTEFIEWEEYVQEAPFDRYADLSGFSDIRISATHVFEKARRRRVVQQPVKSAIFSDKPISFGIAEMYARLMEGARMINVRAFDNRNSAAEWLDVPAKILLPPT